MFGASECCSIRAQGNNDRPTTKAQKVRYGTFCLSTKQTILETIKKVSKSAVRVAYSILGTLRFVIEAASSSLMHRIVGKVKISRLFSAGAGAAFRIEIPLKPRIAANEVLTGVSS